MFPFVGRLVLVLVIVIGVDQSMTIESRGVDSSLDPRIFESDRYIIILTPKLSRSAATRYSEKLDFILLLPYATMT